MALMQTFQDPFISTGLNTNLWTQFTAGSATMSYGNGASVVYPASTTSSTDGDLVSASTYDLTGSYAMLNVTSTASVGAPATTDNIFKLSTGTGTDILTFLVENGTIYAQQIVASSQTNLASTTYNSKTHAWWRIRESGGTTYWETSSNGATWSIFYSAANPITVTALYVGIAGTAWGSATSPGTFAWRYFNTPNATGLPNTITPIKAGGMSAGMIGN